MERKIYKIDFDKMVDDYEHDGDYYGEAESWISLGFKVQLIDRTEDGVAIEIWISIDGESFVYYFFPYDAGVIEIGGIYG